MTAAANNVVQQARCYVEISRSQLVANYRAVRDAVAPGRPCPSSIDGLQKYLGSGMIRGIGPVYAKKMVRPLGTAGLDVIEAEPSRLREVTGIGAVRAKRITDAWAEQKIVREIMVSSCTATGSGPRERSASSRPTARTPSRS